jgi:hypothetical protein
MTKYVIRRALTGELSIKDSPVRTFFDDRFSVGLRDIQAARHARWTCRYDGAASGPSFR